LYALRHITFLFKVRRDAFFANESVLLVDDVLATGGTAAAAMQLVRRCGARAVALAVIVDLNILCAAHPLQLNEVTIVSLVNSRFVPTNGMVRYRPAANTVMSWQELDDRGVVFAHPSMRAFAKHFLRHSPATQAMYRLGRVEWASFPDGWPNITFEPLEHLRNRHVLFFGSLDDPRTVFEQMAFIKVLPRQQIKSLDVVFPYYGPGTMERVDREGVVATAEPLAKMLSELPTCGGSIARLHIYDIHALQERFYFPDTVSVRLHTAVDVLKRHIGMQPVTIVFPDDGAAKRFKQHFEQYPIIVCSKVREGDRRVVRIVDRYNCPDGYDAFQHVLIVDDLCHSGGTLHECRLALVEAGAQRVDAFVTHALFDNNSHVQFFKDNARAGFTRFYVTDTVPRVANKLRNQAPFEVLSIMGSLMKRMPSVERNQDIAIPLHRHSATAARAWSLCLCCLPAAARPTT
jgi:phosphoribosylpyrophosphate synthetase